MLTKSFLKKEERINNKAKDMDILELNKYIMKNSDSEIANTEEFIFIKEINDLIQNFIEKHKISGERNWGKLQGYLTLKLLQKYLDKKLETTEYETAEINSYINGFATEFDLLIIKKGSTGLFSNIYEPKDVKAIIEVKTSGVIASKDEIESKFKRMKQDFENIKNKNINLDFLYITMFERGKPKKDKSLNYLELTKEFLHPYQVFCLFEVVSWQVIPNELASFTNAILHK